MENIMIAGREWLGRIATLSLCAMIFTLPFSKSMVEIFFTVSFVLWTLKKILSYRSHISFINLLKPVSTELNLPIYLFTLLGFLSILTSVSITLSLKGFFFKLLEGVMLYFIVIETINGRKKLNLILISMLLSIGLISIDGIFQFITRYDFIRHYYICQGYKIQASFSNPNGLGGWLIIMIPLALSLDVTKTNSWLKGVIRGILYILISTSIFCLVLTYSRGTWIAFLLAIIFFSILKNKRLIVLIAIILLILSFIVPNIVRERAGSIARLEFNRSLLWQEAVTIIEDFPMLGCGLNTYSVVAPHYKINEAGGIYPHNSYLQMAAEMGFIGLAAFLWIIFRLFKTSLKNLEKIKDVLYKNILIGLLAGLFGFLIHSFFDVDLYALQLANLMWFVMGLIVAIQRMALADKNT